MSMASEDMAHDPQVVRPAYSKVIDDGEVGILLCNTPILQRAIDTIKHLGQLDHHKFARIIRGHLMKPWVTNWRQPYDASWQDCAARGPLCVDITPEVRLALWIISLSGSRDPNVQMGLSCQIIDNALQRLGMNTIWKDELSAIFSSDQVLDFWLEAHIKNVNWRENCMSVPMDMPTLSGRVFGIKKVFHLACSLLFTQNKHPHLHQTSRLQSLREAANLRRDEEILALHSILRAVTLNRGAKEERDRIWAKIDKVQNQWERELAIIREDIRLLEEQLNEELAPIQEATHALYHALMAQV